MKSFWGCDSAQDVRNIDLDTLPVHPDFWMRYLAPEYGSVIALTKPELKYLLDKNIAVGFVVAGYDQEVLENPATVGLGIRAAYALHELGLEEKNAYCAYLDVEYGTLPHYAAIHSFCNECAGLGVIPGLYLNHNIPSHDAAAQAVRSYRGLLWDCEPQYTDWSGLVLPYDQTQPVSINGTIPDMRQYALSQNHATVDFNSCTEAAFSHMKQPHPPPSRYDILRGRLSALNNLLHLISTEVEGW